MSAADDGLKEAASKLHRSQDSLDPALRAHEDRRQAKRTKDIVIGVTIMNALANLVLTVVVGCMAYFVMTPHRTYFAADNNRIIPMTPLSAPYRTPADVISFGKRTLEECFALDFSNYQGQLEGCRGRFTRPGFKSFIDGLQANGILAMIRDRRMNLTSSTGTGVLVADGPEDGTYAWVIRFPLTLKLVGQTTEMPDQRLMATVRIRRIPTLDSVEGIGVAEVVTKPQ
jgi:intracellular multiplication protein IcmL